MAQSGKDDDLDSELRSLHARVLTLPTDVIDRDLAEISHEISFLEAQVSADPGSYSEAGLKMAGARISRFKRKSEILKAELARRGSSNDGTKNL